MDGQPRKAYREPMVWLVFGLPAAVVLASIAMLVSLTPLIPAAAGS